MIDTIISMIEKNRDSYVNESYHKACNDCINIIRTCGLIDYDLEDVKETLCFMDHEDSVVFENPDFVRSIIGVTEDGNVVYSYESMVNELAEEDSMSYEEAAEFIDYNTIRTIPYTTSYGKPPIVVYDLPL